MCRRWDDVRTTKDGAGVYDGIEDVVGDDEDEEGRNSDARKPFEGDVGEIGLESRPASSSQRIVWNSCPVSAVEAADSLTNCTAR